MDLSAAAIAGWHALLPDQLKVAIPNDATADRDEPSARLATDLTTDAFDIGEVLQRHAGIVAGFGAARRTRTLAWIAMRMQGSTVELAALLADERLGGLRTVLLSDLDMLAGAVRTHDRGFSETPR